MAFVWLLDNVKPYLRSKRTKTEYNKGKGMPETGCSLLLSLRAVEYRLFGVVQGAFCFEGMLFWAQKYPGFAVLFFRDVFLGAESSLREDFVR